MGKGIRHPLAYIMEACDDIAYSVLDAEDAVKKRLVSYSDILAYLTATYPDDAMILDIVEKAEKRHVIHRKHDLSPAELNDISTQMFRVFAIGAMISAVIDAFEENYDLIMSGKFDGDLIGSSTAKLACISVVIDARSGIYHYTPSQEERDLPLPNCANPR